jgi:hypothetical protein
MIEPEEAAQPRPPSPQERVASLGRESLLKMLDALSVDDLQECLRIFAPQQPGFRRGHTPVTISKNKFVTALTIGPAKPGSHAWHAYAHAWTDYTAAHYGKAWFDAHRILEGKDGKTSQLKERVETAIGRKSSSRDDLLQTLRLAPIAVAPEIIELAESAPSEQEVSEHRWREDIQNELMTLGQQIRDLQAGHQPPDLTPYVTNAQLDERLKDPSPSPQHLSVVRTEIESVAAALAAERDRADERAKHDSSVGAALDNLRTQLADTLTAVEAMGGIQADVVQIKSALVAFNAEAERLRVQADEMEGIGLDLLLRVGELATREPEAVPAAGLLPQVVESLGSSHVVRRLETRWRKEGEPTQLNTLAEVAAAIRTALQAAGIRDYSAALASAEMAAAIGCGQWVTLRGSCALAIAQFVVAALDPSAMEIVLSATSLAPIVLPPGPATRVLLMEGVNRVAIEVVARDLRLAVVQRQLGLAPLAESVVAVRSEGAATLPVGSELLELGPSIDVDALDWEREPNPTLVPPAKLAIRELTVTPTTLADLEHELSALDGRESRAWRFAASRWFGALGTLGLDKEELLPALVSDWALPLLAVVDADALERLTYGSGSREARVASRLRVQP